MEQVIGNSFDKNEPEGIGSIPRDASLRAARAAEVHLAEVPFAASAHIKGSTEVFQPIGSYMIIRGSENKGLVLLGDDGKPVDVTGKRCALGLSAKDISDYMGERNMNALSLAAGDKHFKRFCDHFGLSPMRAEALRSSLAQIDQKGGSCTRDQIAAMGSMIVPTVPPKARFVLTQDGGTLLAVTPEEVHQIRVKSETGNQLSFGKWEPLPRIARNEITPDHIRKVPGLLALEENSAAAAVYNRDGALMVQRIGSSLGIFDPAQSEKPLFSDNARCFAIDPRRKEDVWFVRENGREIVKIDTSRIQSARRNSNLIELPIQDVRWIGFEESGKYLLLVTQQHDRPALVVYDRESMKPVAALPNVSYPVDSDCSGNLYFRDESGKVHQISTNFKALESGELDTFMDREQDELRELLKVVEEMEIPSVAFPAKKEVAQTDEPNRYIKQAAEVLQRRMGTAIVAAHDEESLRAVSEQIEQLKAREDLSAYPEIFEPLETAVAEKRASLDIGSFAEKLSEGEAALEMGVNVDSAPALAERIADLWKFRREIAIRDRSLKKIVDGQLKELSSRFEQRREELRERVRGNLATELEGLQNSINEAMSIRELENVRGSEMAQSFAKFIAVLDDGERREWSKRLSAMEASRRDELGREGLSQSRDRNARMTAILERLDESFSAMEASLKRVTSQSELQDWQARNALLRNYRSGLSDLPAELRQLREDELQRVLADKERSLTRPAAHDVEVKGGTVQFGKVSFPVFPGYSSVATPKVLPKHPTASVGQLAFEGVGGLLFEPEAAPVSINLEDPATAAAIKQHRESAIRYFEGRERRVPKFQNFWVVNEFVTEQLADLAQYFQMSRNLGKGIVILEGDAGVGKNILFEMLAHYSNRELFTFACNRKTEKEDLTYAYMYDKERGTYRASSELVQAVQTPGALIIFDEVNTLPVGVSKLLNPLFDHRRSLFMPFGQDIVADPSVLFGGAMNPRNYLGTQDLPYEFVDRALMTQVGYPPEKYPDGRYAPYEAEVISQYIGSLRGLKRGEFYRAWNHVVNKENDPTVGRFLDRRQEESLRDLHYIVKLANRLREGYRAYQSGKNSDNEINLVFSMRGAEWIAAAMNLGMDVKSAVKKVVLPKAANPNERAVLEEILRNVDIG